MAAEDQGLKERQMYLDMLGLSDNVAYSLSELRAMTGGGVNAARAAQAQSTDIGRYSETDNFILPQGRPGIDIDTGVFKIGDGITPWADLIPPASGGGGGVTDHGMLTGRGDDDHPQYHTDVRGDVRYYTKSQMNTALSAKAELLGPDDNYVTDAEKVKLTNLSGTNTGDQVLPNWTTISGKPAFVASGADASAARTALGLGSAATTPSTDYAPAAHNQTAATITDLTETVQDIVGALIVAGTNVTVSYNDVANTFTINATGGGGGGTDAEVVRDTIAAALVAGSGIQITVDDASDTITIASTAVLPTRQVNSGTGLTGGGDLSANRTLSVSYGTTAGTSAEGNDSRITGAVQSTRQVIAGTGLSGGGSLAADRTLAVSYGTAAGTAAQGNDSRIGKIGGTVTVSGTPTAGQVPIASSGTAAAWGTPSGGSALLVGNGYLKIPTGRYAHAWGADQIQANTWTSLNEMHFVPLALTVSNTFSEATVVVGTAQTGASVRLGIYSASASTGFPDTLIQEFGTVSATTTGQKNLAISGNITLAAGLYWMTAVNQSSGSAATLTRYAFSTYNRPALFGENNAASTFGFMIMKQTGVTGALPSSATPVIGDQIGALISLKAA